MNDDLKNILNLILSHFPYYGEFSVLDKIRAIDNAQFQKVFRLIGNPTQQAIELTDFLIENGFAIRRNDVKSDFLVIELSLRGRWLKQMGSFELYKQSQTEKKEKKLKEEQEIENNRNRNKEINTLTRWIALATIIAGIYYLLEILNHIFGFYCH